MFASCLLAECCRILFELWYSVYPKLHLKTAKSHYRNFLWIIHKPPCEQFSFRRISPQKGNCHLSIFEQKDSPNLPKVFFDALNCTNQMTFSFVVLGQWQKSRWHRSQSFSKSNQLSTWKDPSESKGNNIELTESKSQVLKLMGNTRKKILYLVGKRLDQ